MRTDCRQAVRPGPIDIGILSAMLLMLAVFEVIPSMSVGRLAVTTREVEMTGFDPGDLYVIPPDLPDVIPVDIDKIINDIPPVEIDPVRIISTGDPAGLDTVSTVGNRDLLVIEDPLTGGIPGPGTWIEHSQAPMCTYRPMPEYPEMARLAGLEGRVTLQLFITVDGVPIRVELIQSSGIGSMDEAAVDIAWDSRWTPAKSANGNAVGVWTAMVYEFVLD